MNQQTLESKNGTQIVVPEGTTQVEVIIREGAAQNLLDVKAPFVGNIAGVINTPTRYLEKRVSTGQFPQRRCHILVDRENVTIQLVINESDPYLRQKISGELLKNPKVEQFGINTGKKWDANELGQFLKMNRAYFVDKQENMSLVTNLKNFEAKINSTIQKTKSESGDFADNFSGTVTSNLPGAFKISIPLFKGMPAEDLEVEFFANVSGRTVTLELYSPGANQAFEDIRDRAIDAELLAIMGIAPAIVIMEV